MFGRRSDRAFSERSPRGVKPQTLGGSRPEFKYFPAGSSMGFPVGAIPDSSRVGVQFFEEFGIRPSEAAQIVGWHPALHARKG